MAADTVDPNKDFACTTPPPLGLDAPAFFYRDHVSSVSLKDENVRALWKSEKDFEAPGSDFSSASTSTYDEDLELVPSNASATATLQSLGPYQTTHEKALIAWELHQDILRQKLDAYGLKSLNPKASEFVPQNSPSVATFDHPTLPPGSLPCWFPFFEQVTQSPTEDIPRMKREARSLVRSVAWNSQSITELAQHLCWTGSNCDGDKHTFFLARFSVYLSEELKEHYGRELAREFLWHLRECCLGTYQAFWDLTSPQAISFQTANALYIRSALCLTTFIGDLFKCGLLCAFQTMTCIRILVGNSISLHHLEALSSLVMHAGKDLWYTHPSEVTSSEGALTVLPIQAARAMMVKFKKDLSLQLAKIGSAADCRLGSEPSVKDVSKLHSRPESEVLLQKMWEVLEGWLQTK
ncbi:hypothetical protein ONZ45_g5974 [Pleurotus djamor]|nr:hypothetical protein ONZ45_g5974 [Pleurotus djamor]